MSKELVLTEREKKLMEEHGVDEADIRAIRRAVAADDVKRERAEARDKAARELKDSKDSDDDSAEDEEEIEIA